MRKGRFTEEQVIKVLNEHAAGLSASGLCRKHGISDATFCRSRHDVGTVGWDRRYVQTQSFPRLQGQFITARQFGRCEKARLCGRAFCFSKPPSY